MSPVLACCPINAKPLIEDIQQNVMLDSLPTIVSDSSVERLSCLMINAFIELDHSF